MIYRVISEVGQEFSSSPLSSSSLFARRLELDRRRRREGMMRENVTTEEEIQSKSREPRPPFKRDFAKRIESPFRLRQEFRRA